MMLGRLASRVGRVIPSLVTARQIAPCASVLVHSEKHFGRTLFGQNFEASIIAYLSCSTRNVEGLEAVHRTSLLFSVNIDVKNRGAFSIKRALYHTL